MHRSRVSSRGGPFSSSAASSRATATTRCQKCLKLGHYSYECTTGVQDRPYIPRPSRTQQLNNPKLLTKLAEVKPPEEPSLTNKDGTADAILKAKEEERRGRKRARPSSPSPPPRGRSRSSSVSSYSSYSSTSSRAPTPPAHSHNRENASRSRRRRSFSYSRSPEHERSVRRKYRASPSPHKRGRRLSPIDYSRRTRSRSPKRQMRKQRTPVDEPMPQVESDWGGRSLVGARGGSVGDWGKREIPPPREAKRDRSMSPFTRRRLMTEAMRRGG